jgi:hypothetical protein
MGRLEQRIKRIEASAAQSAHEVFRIVCTGASPSASEQALIDEAESRGAFVICRVIVEHEPEVRI